jgi:hypothetical protein
VGLARGPAGEVILNPDEEVQARIRLVAGEISEHPLGWRRDAVSPSSAVAAASLSQSWPCSLRDRLATRTDLGHPRYTPQSGPMREPMSMDASSLSQRVAPQHTQLAGGFSNLLTSGRCVYTLDIQHISCGKNVERIRRNYAQTACARRVERPGVARKGQALVQGIVRCGRCGALLHLHSSGRKARIS